MIKDLSSYFIEIVASSPFGFSFRIPDVGATFPPGTNIHATAALSHLGTAFSSREAQSVSRAYIESFTAFIDGRESQPIFSGADAQTIRNCASVTLRLFGDNVSARGQFNLYFF
jgi:hypothetical protein